jgi:hypothetical protein
LAQVRLRVCSNCGSNLVVPSSQCNPKDRHFQLDFSGILLALIALGGLIIGIFMLYVVIEHWITTGQLGRTKSQDELLKNVMQMV